MTRKAPPQFSERMTPRQQADKLNEIARDLYSIYGAIDVAPPLKIRQGGSSGIQLSIDAPTTFLARLTGVFTPTTGTYSGVNIYSFVEQQFDPNGFPIDAVPGQATQPNPPVSGAMPTSSWATEINNNLLTVPGPTPTGYPNPGPYVEMRLVSQANGVPVYEFTSPVAGFWARITGQATIAPLNVYSFEQVDDPTPPNGWVVTSGGITGTLNAEEVNENDSVPIDSIVWMTANLAEKDWYAFSWQSSGDEWVKCTSVSPQTVTTGYGSTRTVNDGVLTYNSLTLTSATANFTSADVGAYLTGTGIPSGTRVYSINSSTSIQMNAYATVTASGVSVTITQPDTTLTAYDGVVVTWDNKAADWVIGSTVWLYDVNGNTPMLDNIYRCNYLGDDVNGAQIWGEDVGQQSSSGGYTGSIAVVTSAVWDASSCSLTTTTKTITVNNGLITGVS